MRLFIIKLLKQTSFFKPIKNAYSFFASLGKKKNIKKIKVDGCVMLPNTIVFEPTIKCNLSCAMCYQKNERATKEKDLSLEQIKIIFLRLGKNKPKNVSLIGAEVFMRPDLVEIIEFFGELGIKVYLATNGTLIDEKMANKLIKLKNITGIGYSMDGMRALHNKIRGTDYAFDRLVKAINLTKNFFSVTVNTVVMDDNIDQIIEVGRFLKVLGVSNYALQFEMASTPDELEESKKILGINEQDFAVEVKNNNDYRFTVEQVSDLLGNLEAIKGLFIFVQPGVFEENHGSYLSGDLRKKENLYCKDINTLRINARGEVIFCPFIKKVFGNLLETNLGEIWNSQDFKDFRIRLLRGNLTPVCKRCCRLGLLDKK